jgi:FKBP-type peptidyl-prolyl cis-trans isomerase SlyD
MNRVAAGQPGPRPALLPRQRTSIAEGRVVFMRYTMTLDDGRVVESRGTDAPFAYLHGAGNVVPGLEIQLHERQAGETFRVSVPPELAFGQIDPDHIKRIPRTDFPSDARLTPGMRFRSQLDDGMLLPAWVVDVDDRTVTVSFNHPLAGETLHFDVEVIEIRDARPDELIHGHPHGPGGVPH